LVNDNIRKSDLYLPFERLNGSSYRYPPWWGWSSAVFVGMFAFLLGMHVDGKESKQGKFYNTSQSMKAKNAMTIHT